MFDGMPDQFYQFLAARTATTASPSPSPSPSISLPLSFSLHHHNHGGAAFTSAFDPSPYPLSPPPSQPQPQQGFLSPPITHLLHHPQLAPLHLQLKNEDKEEAVLPSELEQIDNTWSNDEVLALLRIRSSLDNNWFPDLITWENVSRKLGELGFKRSAEKCKEKFEEETRSFNRSINANNCSSKNSITSIQNYRLFGELEDLYNIHHPQHHGDNDQDRCPPPPAPSPRAVDEHHEPPSMFSKRNQSPSRQLDDDHEVEEAVLEEAEEDKAGEKRERSAEEEDTEKNDKVVGDENSVDDSEKTEENTKRVMRKRKRQKKFEMFKGFCESIVNQMMAQQEQLHCKILQDMVKRDEAKIAREEAWKKQEVERIQKEMEVRAHELAIASDRQAKILAFLNKFTSSTDFSLESQSLVEAIDNLVKVQNISSTSSIDLTQDYSISAIQPTSSCTTHDQSPSFLVAHNSPNMPTSSSNENLEKSPSIDQVSQNPNENDSFRLPSIPVTHKSSGLLGHTNTDAADHSTIEYRSPENQTEPNPKPNMENSKDDTGRRWPRDEVLALINIRCSLFSNTNNDAHHESKDQSSTRGIPLWERISQRMTEMGYNRSAKRCKEKWENINKYFRKTKDLNKKRSIDSRTCPYFHQLSHLYRQGQGTMLGTTDPQVNHLPPGSPEERTTPALSGARGGSTTAANADDITTTVHGTTAQVDEGSSVVQVPVLDFEF